MKRQLCILFAYLGLCLPLAALAPTSHIESVVQEYKDNLENTVRVLNPTGPHALENEHQSRLWLDEDGHFRMAYNNNNHFLPKQSSLFEGLLSIRIDQNQQKLILSFKQRKGLPYLEDWSHFLGERLENTPNDQGGFDAYIPLDLLRQPGGWVPGAQATHLELSDQYRLVARKPGGGMQGGIFQDTQGYKWMVKEAGNASSTEQPYIYEWVIREVTFFHLFKEMGLPVPNVKIIRGKQGKLFVASEYREGLKDIFDPKSDIKPTPANVNLGLFGKLFIVSALMGNWDFFTGGNVRFYKDSKGIYQPVLMDIGETLGPSSHIGHFFDQDNHQYTNSDIFHFVTQPPAKANHAFEDYRNIWHRELESINKVLATNGRAPNTHPFTDVIRHNIFDWSYHFLQDFNQLFKEINTVVPPIEDIDTTTTSRLSSKPTFLNNSFIRGKDQSSNSVQLSLSKGKDPMLTLRFSSPEAKQSYYLLFDQKIKALNGHNHLSSSIFMDTTDNQTLFIKPYDKITRTGWALNRNGELQLYFPSHSERMIFTDVFGLDPQDIIGKSKPRVYVRHALKNTNKLYFNPRSRAWPNPDKDKSKRSLFSLKNRRTKGQRFTLQWNLRELQAINSLDRLRAYDQQVIADTHKQIEEHVKALMQSFETLVAAPISAPASSGVIQTSPSHNVVVQFEQGPQLIIADVSSENWNQLTKLLQEGMGLSKQDYFLKIKHVHWPSVDSGDGGYIAVLQKKI